MEKHCTAGQTYDAANRCFRNFTETFKNDLSLQQIIHTTKLFTHVDAYVSNVAVGTPKDMSTSQDADRRPH